MIVDQASQENKNLKGNYANHFEIGHNALEFILDFSQSYDVTEEAELCTRVVTSPSYAKALLQVLEKAITQFEQSYGTIE